MAAELLAACAAAGLDKEAVFDLLTRFAPTITMRRAGFVEHKYQPVTFALRDADKDLHLATEVYHRAGAYTPITDTVREDRKSTRLNSSHSQISYAVFCLKKKNKTLRSSNWR